MLTVYKCNFIQKKNASHHDPHKKKILFLSVCFTILNSTVDQ